MTPEQKRQYVQALKPVFSRVRRDVTARKYSDGSSRWTNDPLTTIALEHHVNGGPARGVCPIKAGESVTMLALFDLDSHKGATSWEDMMGVACTLSDRLSLMGYDAIGWRSSGGKGIHLYVLWDTPQDAYSVRLAMTQCLAMAGYESGAGGVAKGQIEVFPKQNEVALNEYGNQFILPLAGQSTPLDLELGLPLPRDAALTMAWPSSAPVPVAQRPERTVVLAESVEPIDRVRQALFAIRNDGEGDSPDYERWFTLCCAVHEATGGSPEGEELFDEWSAQNPIHDPKFFKDRVWDYVKPAGDRSSAITRGSLYAAAAAAGWSNATPDGFEDVPGAVLDTVVASAGPSSDLGFADVGGSVSAGVDGRDLPPFERKSNGTINSTIGNLVLACRDPQVCRWRIAHDKFRDEIMVAPPGTAQDAWRPFTDADYVRLRVWLERNDFEPIGKEAMRDAVHLVAHDQAFDSAILWVDSLKWDGVPRIDSFMERYLGAEPSAYATAVGQYTWTALAGRLLSPGIQADMVPVFIGAQGSGKSSAVMAMSPAPDFYVEVGFHEKEDDLARKMRGRVIGEIGELTGFRKKEVEAMKAFITRRFENWIPKFKEFGATFPRRLLFIGTTNQQKFLVDDTGNRRWLPINVGETELDLLKADVMQLWAEGAARFKEGGIAWQDAERLAREIHSQHTEEDPWESQVWAWLNSPDFDGGLVSDREFLSTSEVLLEAMKLDSSRTTRGDNMRAASVLKNMGYSGEQKWVDGRNIRVFVRKAPQKIGEVVR